MYYKTLDAIIVVFTELARPHIIVDLARNIIIDLSNL